MKNQFTDIEQQIAATLKIIVINIRGNQAGDGKAIVDLDSIGKLHKQLDIYKKQIEKEQVVNKDIVGMLLYTCSRFHLQSKYSRNKEELLDQFEKLNIKLLELYIKDF
ncbi:hypothetical protein NQ117_06515 [Paenibacillus sp. SC116]|uniref:hypothetical protein n=1 Tax=Paenibacillus sp. SC116 TaxID=2968986 RepID=UPI00215ADDDB|nr:hypothetical protein [Paenibacillus sp. SC116]MCR8843331.1 hypothetical protein [Paenibacillus sp. SC116]